MRKGYFIQGFITGAVIMLFLYAIVLSIIAKQPTAMDVYQGKTTLEITYKDGVPIDSTVVFKD